jgi:hypothetical protein
LKFLWKCFSIFFHRVLILTTKFCCDRCLGPWIDRHQKLKISTRSSNNDEHTNVPIISQLNLASYVKFPISTNNSNFVNYNLKNITTKFGSNWLSDLVKKDWNVKFTDEEMMRDAKWYLIAINCYMHENI